MGIRVVQVPQNTEEIYYKLILFYFVLNLILFYLFKYIGTGSLDLVITAVMTQGTRRSPLPGCLNEVQRILATRDKSS